MFRPTGFADLAGRRVGIFGYGVEGRAAARRLERRRAEPGARRRRPGLDARSAGRAAEGGHDALLTCDVVLKSPGDPAPPSRRARPRDPRRRGHLGAQPLAARRRPFACRRDHRHQGQVDDDGPRLVLPALRSASEPCDWATSDSRPTTLPSTPREGWLVLEVSSFQCVDVDVAPGMVVVTSLGADHLDWHGTVEEYRDDKLSLTRAWGEHVTLVPANATFHGVADQLGGERDVRRARRHAPGGIARTDGRAQQLQCRAGASLRRDADGRTTSRSYASAFANAPRPSSRCAVVSRSWRAKSARVRRCATSTTGWPRRCCPTVAALEVFADDPVALIAGGFDRGVDYIAARHAPWRDASSRRCCVTMGRRRDERSARPSRPVAPGTSCSWPCDRCTTRCWSRDVPSRLAGWSCSHRPRRASIATTTGRSAPTDFAAVVRAIVGSQSLGRDSNP